MTALLFDVDGVLADTEHLHRKALEQAAALHGYTVPDTDARTTTHKLVAAGVPEHLIQPVYANKRDIYDQLVQKLPRSVALSRALYTLHGRGHRMAACTNSNRISAVKLLKHLGIYGVFSTVVTSSDVDNGKPAPDIYLQALDILSAVRANSVVFEDSDVGIRAAQAAGIPNIIRCTTASLLKELEPWLL